MNNSFLFLIKKKETKKNGLISYSLMLLSFLHKIGKVAGIKIIQKQKIFKKKKKNAFLYFFCTKKRKKNLYTK